MVITALGVVGVVKGGLAMAAGYGGSKVAGAVIKKIIADEVGMDTLTKIGMVALTGAAGTIASKYVVDTIDQLVTATTDVIKAVKEQNNLKKNKNHH